MGLDKQQRIYEKSLNKYTKMCSNSQVLEFKDLDFKMQIDCAIQWLARHKDIDVSELGHIASTVFVDPNEITYLVHTFFVGKVNDFISVVFEYLIDLFSDCKGVVSHFEVKLSLILTELYTHQSFTFIREGKYSMATT